MQEQGQKHDMRKRISQLDDAPDDYCDHFVAIDSPDSCSATRLKLSDIKCHCCNTYFGQISLSDQWTIPSNDEEIPFDEDECSCGTTSIDTIAQHPYLNALFSATYQINVAVLCEGSFILNIHRGSDDVVIGTATASDDVYVEATDTTTGLEFYYCSIQAGMGKVVQEAFATIKKIQTPPQIITTSVENSYFVIPADDDQSVVEFDEVQYDTGGMFSVGQPDRISIQEEGYYQINASCFWDITSGEGYAGFYIQCSGHDNIGQTSYIGDALGSDLIIHWQSASRQEYMVAGSQVLLRLFRTPATSVPLYAFCPMLTVTKMG